MNITFTDCAPNVSIDATHGALLLGLFASLGLLGVCTVQLFYYASHYSDDPNYLKFMVGSLWLSEAIGCSLAFHGVYRTNIETFHYFNEPHFCNDIPPTLKIVMLFNGFTYAIVQGFFAYRLKVISRKIWLTRTCWFTSGFRFIADLLLLAFALAHPVVTFTRKYRAFLYLAMLTGSFTDCLIAGSLSYWFVKQKQDEVPDSNRILRRLLAFSMESGAITSLFGICVLITGVTMPHNFVWISLIIVHSKFHSNSLFVSLNRRRILRGRRDAALPKLRSPLTAIHFANFFSGRTSSSYSSRGDELRIQEVEVQHEDPSNCIQLQPVGKGGNRCRDSNPSRHSVIVINASC